MHYPGSPTSVDSRHPMKTANSSHTWPLFVTVQGLTNPLLLAICVVPTDPLLLSPEVTAASNPFRTFKELFIRKAQRLGRITE